MKIKLFDTSLPLPQYHTQGSVGLDLYARIAVTIAPHSIERVPLNVAMQYPEGYWGLFTARSSLHKRGLMMPNGVAIMDPDFSGNEDEFQAPLYNFTDHAVMVEKGDRLVQLVLLPATQATILQVDALTASNRGGIGSTGK